MGFGFRGKFPLNPFSLYLAISLQNGRRSMASLCILSVRATCMSAVSSLRSMMASLALKSMARQTSSTNSSARNFQKKSPTTNERLLQLSSISKRHAKTAFPRFQIQPKRSLRLRFVLGQSPMSLDSESSISTFRM